MADYWKSQAKKFCDFCKCWIADNKPSIEFHEKGKRHKENVEKRLKEIGQKSRKEHKESIKVDVEMKKMEEAAMAAYLKDIEGGGDFTSQQLQKEKEERLKEEEQRKALEMERMKELEKEKESEESESEDSEEALTSSDVADSSAQEKNTSPWYEAKSDEGFLYYWHTETGESVWEPPAEGFVSVAEQMAQEEARLKAEKDSEEKRCKEEQLVKRKEEKLQQMKKEQEEKERKAEESARRAREKMKSRAVKGEKKEIVPFEPEFIGPAPRQDPYGGWQTVQRCEETPVDLQLPERNWGDLVASAPVTVEAAPKFKIKEKTIGSIDCEGSSDFKKRKFNSSSKRNVRQRLDDD